MGVTTAWGVVGRLVAVAGYATASRLLLTAQTLDATEALRLGVFDAVAEDDDPVTTALSWAGDVARGAPGAVRELKAMLRDVARGVPELRASERARFVASWTSEDHREAVEAYFGGRTPVWKAR
jgi:enoyl-CoA hydratase/carnithine racemase